jgi:hypothetical protein
VSSDEWIAGYRGASCVACVCMSCVILTACSIISHRLDVRTADGNVAVVCRFGGRLLYITSFVGSSNIIIIAHNTL